MRINIEEATGTSYKERNSLYFPFYTVRQRRIKLDNHCWARKMNKDGFIDNDQIHRINEVLHEVCNESDRAAAILIGVEIDDALEKAIQAYLLPPPNRNDLLFRPDGPLGSFSSRIELAYRLGLISGLLKREIHLIRRVRNEFAHRPAGLTFGKSPVIDYCLELHFATWVIAKREDLQNELSLNTPRTRFTLTGAVIIALLSGLPKRTNRVMPKLAEFGGMTNVTSPCRRRLNGELT